MSKQLQSWQTNTGHGVVRALTENDLLRYEIRNLKATIGGLHTQINRMYRRMVNVGLR